jgi:SAM-dependent methyltransferase
VDGPAFREQLIRTYDAVAGEYADEFWDELDHKPFDRDLLSRLVRGVPEGLRVCDLGCGPGHAAHFLRSLGADAFGIDLSPEMVRVARRRSPGIEFVVGDMLALDLPSASLGGVVALYSAIHVARSRIGDAFAEMARVVAPGGFCLASFHRGEGELSADEWFGKPICFRCALYEPEELRAVAEGAGLSEVVVHVRQPYDTEHPTERIYVHGGAKLAAGPPPTG